ncbi:MAG: hypothetical protein V8R08_00875 [Coriobacteriales bacterium]
MPLFSEKYGYTDPKTVLQHEEASDDLRMSIYNVLYQCVGEYRPDSTFEQICEDLWTEYWHKPIDTFPSRYWYFYPELKSKIIEGEWFEAYDIIDFLLEKFNQYAKGVTDLYYGDGWTHSAVKAYVESINEVLEREGSGYRIIDNSVAPITNETEIASIERASKSSGRTTGASAYIQQALEAISKKPNPDYNSVVSKSILAVESAAKAVAPGKNNTLADALSSLGKSAEIHPAIIEGWKNIYGFSSDAGGIRHAKHNEPVEVDFAFAKYMLVTCSAFVNYLVEEFGNDEEVE